VTQDVTQISVIELSPDEAEVDAGRALRYNAVGFDAAGNRIREVTGEATFTISPDGSCRRSACTATTAGPHTVTASIGGPATGSATGSATGASTGGVTVDRAGHVRTPLALVALDVVTGTASLSVTQAPTSCLISASDVRRPLTANAEDSETGTTVRVDAALDPVFATCEVLVRIDGAPLDSPTAVGVDGRVSASAVVPLRADGGGNAQIVTIDGTTLATARFRIPPPPNTPSLLWLLFAGLLIVAGAAVLQERARRQRRWVHQHVKLNPNPVPARISAVPHRDSPPSFTVRLRPQAEPGTIVVTEEGHADDH
jgi:hypothetical protein